MYRRKQHVGSMYSWLEMQRRRRMYPHPISIGYLRDRLRDLPVWLYVRQRVYWRFYLWEMLCAP